MTDRNVRIINLTGHTITLGSQDRSWRFRSYGRARCDAVHDQVSSLHLWDGETDTGIVVPLLELSTGPIVSLPTEYTMNRFYVTSGIVEANVDRPDVVAMGRVHKEGGRVMYGRALMRRIR